MWVLGIKPGSSRRAAKFFIAEPSLHALLISFHQIICLLPVIFGPSFTVRKIEIKENEKTGGPSLVYF